MKMKSPRFTPRFTGTLQIIASGIGFGFLGIFVKLSLATGLGVGELLTWRFITAAALLWLSVLCFRPALIRITPRELLICAALGISGYTVFSTLYFLSIQGVSASLAALLLYTFPVLVTIGGHVLLKECVRPRQWLALPAALLGLLALLWGEIDVRSWIAVACGLGSAFCYSLYILASRKWQTDISPLTSGLYVITFAAFGLFAFHRPDPKHLLSLDIRQYALIGSMAILSTIGPMVLFLSGLQKLKSAEASVLSTMEPITAALLSALLFGEHFGFGHFAGALGILSAVALTVEGA